MFILVKSEEFITHSEHSDEEYGDWCTESEFNIGDVTVYPEILRARKVYVDGDIYAINKKYEKSLLVYVVYVTFSSGDSFGNSSGNGIVVWAFSDRKLAEDCLEEVNNCAGKDNYKFTIEDGNGGFKQTKLSNPTTGYFEHMEDSGIVEKIVNVRS